MRKNRRGDCAVCRSVSRLQAALSSTRAMHIEAFPNGIAASTPLNATPYVFTQAEFLQHFGFSPARQNLLAAFTTTLQLVGDNGAVPLFAIVGGSILDDARQDPRDLDVAIFYRASLERPPDAARLQSLCHSVSRERKLDLRLLPFDGPAAMTAKLIGFFTILYSQRRSEAGVAPVAIVDLCPSVQRNPTT